MAIKNPEKLVELLVEKMRVQAQEARTDKAQIDVSGGIDSAVVAALAVRAFGKDKVIGTYTSISSSPESLERAKMVSRAFGFSLVQLELTQVYDSIVDAVRREFLLEGIPFPDPSDPKSRTVFGSLRSCLRAPIGRFVNRAFGGGIRQGTGNRDEDELLRFYQKGGDGEVDCNWIAGLFKGEVWELAEHLGVPQEIIKAKPTPDLWGVGEAHNDESELKDLTGVPLTYTRPGDPEGRIGTIEWVSRENQKNGIVNGAAADKDPRDLGYSDGDSEIIEAVRKIERTTRHKAETPPYLTREELLNAEVVE